MVQGTKGTTEPVKLGTFSVPTMSWGGNDFELQPHASWRNKFHSKIPREPTSRLDVPILPHAQSFSSVCVSAVSLYSGVEGHAASGIHRLQGKQSLMELLTRHYADHITETNLPAELLQMLEP